MQNLSTHAGVSIAGEYFTYNEALKPGGLFSAVAVSVATILGGAALVIPPLRFLLRKVVPKPGSGESVSSNRSCIRLILAAHYVPFKCDLTVAFSISVYCQMHRCPTTKS